MAGDVEHLADFFVRDIHRPGNFFLRWLAFEDLLKTMPGFLDSIDRLTDVNREPDCAALVRDRPGNRLANPPGRIGAEFETAGVVEFVGGLHQADVAFLNQVEKGKTATDIFLRDGNDETEIRLDQMRAGRVAINLVVKQRSPDIL